ncbi:MAG: sugar transferase [Thermoanaerobaculales bacterium]|jgi:exopolysaccharide biosynthesis polyprenyl glycosylphosphotransferase|nr:sugar transferase [Thermoanaerobaculales bacterium]
MLKERAKLVAYWVWTTDLVLTTVAFLLAWWLRSHVLPQVLPQTFPTELYPLSRYLGLLPLVLAIWTFLLVTRESYTSRRTVALAVEAWHVFQIVGAGILTLAAAGWLLRLDFVSRPFLLIFGAINLALLLAEKLALRLSARHVRSRGLNYRTLLIVGINPRSEEIARIIEEHPHWGLKLLGFVAPNGSFPETVDGLPVLGRAEDLGSILQRLVVDEVIFVLSRRQLEEFEDSFLLCSELGIRTRVALSFPHMKARVILEEVEGIPLLTFTNTPGAVFPLFVKLLADLVISTALLIVLSPLLALIGLTVWLTSKGPMLYRQRRCGLNGRRFTLYKFRTMYEGADRRLDEVAHLNEVNGPAFKARRDPRVTPVGRWLRRWSLDELPQLVNVLKGEMSLVGPRPPIPEEVERYERWQRRRLSMKPGITGLWQVSGRAGIDDFSDWIALDLRYIDQWSLWLDLKILLKTIPAVLFARGAA